MVESAVKRKVIWNESDARDGNVLPLACMARRHSTLFGPYLVISQLSPTFPFPKPKETTMPIAPITGKLRKHFLLDVSVAFSLGVSAGYAYW